MISFKSLSRKEPLDKVVIHSLDCSLYQVSIIRGDVEELVCDAHGKPLKARSVLELEALFEGFPVHAMVLRQESAYDEMINQPVRAGSNRMEVPVGRNRLGYK